MALAVKPSHWHGRAEIARCGPLLRTRALRISLARVLNVRVRTLYVGVDRFYVIPAIGRGGERLEKD
jgi:hypothetical protein